MLLDNSKSRVNHVEHRADGGQPLLYEGVPKADGGAEVAGRGEAGSPRVAEEVRICEIRIATRITDQ